MNSGEGIARTAAPSRWSPASQRLDERPGACSFRTWRLPSSPTSSRRSQERGWSNQCLQDQASSPNVMTDTKPHRPGRPAGCMTWQDGTGTFGGLVRATELPQGTGRDRVRARGFAGWRVSTPRQLCELAARRHRSLLRAPTALRFGAPRRWSSSTRQHLQRGSSLLTLRDSARRSAVSAAPRRSCAGPPSPHDEPSLTRCSPQSTRLHSTYVT